jgi:hypothetical protein
MVGRLIASLFAASVALLLAACNAQAQQRKVAMNAIAILRERFNEGSCRLISSDIDTSSNDVKTEWLNGCERLRRDLPLWNRFTDSRSTSLAPVGNVGTVMVEGRALFGDGSHTETYWLETYWHIKEGRAQLYFFQLSGGDKQISLPQALPPVNRL